MDASRPEHKSQNLNQYFTQSSVNQRKREVVEKEKLQLNSIIYLLNNLTHETFSLSIIRFYFFDNSMNRSNKYEDKNEEYLHPFWLGILLLLTVITILSILCFIRRKCGSQIMRSCKIFFCGTDYDLGEYQNTIETVIDTFPLENRAKKRSNQLSSAGPYNWAPAYNPVPNQSPKLYALVRNMQMNSFDREASIRQTTVDEDDDVHDVFTIPDESEQMKVDKR